MSIRTLSSALAGLVVAAALGCSDSPTSPRLLLGTYRLAAIDLLQLPTPEPCGSGLNILNGHLVLESHYRVTLAQTDHDEMTGWDLSYSGAGEYYQKGNQLLLDLTERWSGDTTTYHRRLTLDVQEHEIVMHGLGGACDANSAAHYQLVEP